MIISRASNPKLNIHPTKTTTTNHKPPNPNEPTNHPGVAHAFGITTATQGHGIARFHLQSQV